MAFQGLFGGGDDKGGGEEPAAEAGKEPVVEAGTLIIEEILWSFPLKF